MENDFLKLNHQAEDFSSFTKENIVCINQTQPKCSIDTQQISISKSAEQRSTSPVKITSKKAEILIGTIPSNSCKKSTFIQEPSISSFQNSSTLNFDSFSCDTQVAIANLKTAKTNIENTISDLQHKRAKIDRTLSNLHASTKQIDKTIKSIEEALEESE